MIMKTIAYSNKDDNKNPNKEFNVLWKNLKDLNRK